MFFFNLNKKLLHVYICCARPNGRTVRHIIELDTKTRGRLFNHSCSKSHTTLLVIYLKKNNTLLIILSNKLVVLFFGIKTFISLV